MAVWGLMQGIEHANKCMKNRMLKWTNSKPGYLASLLRQIYLVFLGGMALFHQFCDAVSTLPHQNEELWKKFFPTRTPEGLKPEGTVLVICSCCGKGSDNTDVRKASEHIDASTEPGNLDSVHIADLLQQPFPAPRKLHNIVQFKTLFSAHLKLGLEANICKNCAVMFQFLVALQFGFIRTLPYINLDKIKFDDVYENDELFEDDIELEEENM
jgi:hypothetical protein